MKTLGIFAILLLTSTAVFAQSRGAAVSSGNTRTVAAPATHLVQRSAGTVLFPSGTVPPAVVNNPVTSLGFNQRLGVSRSTPLGTARSGGFQYAYPVYVGGGYGGYYDNSYAGQPVPPQAGQDQPNVVVVYPPQQPPVIINQFGPGDSQYATRMGPQSVYPMQAAPAQAEEPEATHYLIAFKDHSIYSAVAYWVDGDTLHYFTTGSTHNQASVSLVDRELTDRLNKESGLEVKLPPVK